MSGEPPVDVDIEPADADDADRIADMWVALATDQRRHGSHLRPEENRSRIHESMLQHAVADTALVARRAGAVVGFVTYGVETDAYEQDVTRGIVYNLYVTPDHRGEGIGSALLAAAEAELDADGADAIGLQAMADNEAARSFYRDHGYTPHRVELEKAIRTDTLKTDDG